MMYNNKFIVAVKSDGKVLREFKDSVMVPFGSEYSLLLKNLNSKRAIVNITIDGTDVVPDGLVVNANSEINLERFIKDSNLTTGNKFKFIARTTNIEEHRGIKAEDGLVRVSFKYEVDRPVTNPYHNGTWKWEPNSCSPNWPYYSKNIVGGITQGNIYGSIQSSFSAGNTGDSTLLACANTIANSAAPQAKTTGILRSSAPIDDTGITVPGSISEQKFSTVSSFATEVEEHVMILKLVGETEQGIVTEPITVKSKPKCTTCGKLNKAVNKFCSDCGTSLVIV